MFKLVTVSTRTTRRFERESLFQLCHYIQNLPLAVVQGPEVGSFACDGDPGQLWYVAHNAIVFAHLSAMCLSEASFSTGIPAQVVINEFGNGQLTILDENVMDQCIGVCRLDRH